ATALELARQDAVKEAFQHAWAGYTEHCFGRDSIQPVSNTCVDDFGGYGATAIDALSTAIMFGQENATVQILEFIADLDFAQVKGGTRIQVFEVTIRHLAAMISAWDLLDGPFSTMAVNHRIDLRQALYRQMVRLGDVLACAFDTPTGIPHDWVDPAKCSASGTMNTVAGAGTVLLEFGRLTTITGDQKYIQLARRAEGYLLEPQPASKVPFPGLLGSYLSIDSGELVDSRGSWGAFADSFYEYLIKAYLYDPDTYQLYLEKWTEAADSTMQSIGSHPYGNPDLTLLATWDGTSLDRKMESLSYFAGGSFILGGMTLHNQTLIDYGLSIANAAGAVYSMTATGLGGEFVTWIDTCDQAECNPKDSIQIIDGRFRLRPEVLETWYYAWRATRDQKYREWSWAAFEAINRYCRTDTGYSAIEDVDAVDGGSKTDVQESFVFAEVMKYVYLTHLEDENAPFHVQDSRTGRKNTWVYNTEAHPVRVAGRPV
ncbi:glycoside hydrolase, partial [Teratosphaeria destructans]